MKKLFSFVALLFFVASPAFALSEGDYLELDGVYTKTTFHLKENANNKLLNHKPSYSSGTNGVGLTYKSAYNLGQSNFFIAPGVFVEQNSFGSSAVYGKDQLKLQIRNRLGAKVDFGYDIADIVSPYLTIGYSIIKYNSRSSGFGRDDNSVVVANKAGSKASEFFGVGARFPLKNNLSLNFEYNYQKFDTKNSIPAQSSDYIAKSSFRTRLDIFKVGLAYKF
ncbi:MAG: outer membrane beta-barrel protein [Rickettsiales bacterium]|nr:outer membrane beta-barrel protein [Rickettsiales bacterium]